MGAASGTTTDGAVWTLGYPGIAAACDPGLKTTSTKCWKVVRGDVDGTGSTVQADLTSVRGRLGQVTTSSNYKRDYDASGSILQADLTGVRGRLGNTCVGCVCVP